MPWRPPPSRPAALCVAFRSRCAPCAAAERRRRPWPLVSRRGDRQFPSGCGPAARPRAGLAPPVARLDAPSVLRVLPSVRSNTKRQVVGDNDVIVEHTVRTGIVEMTLCESASIERSELARPCSGCWPCRGRHIRHKRSVFLRRAPIGRGAPRLTSTTLDHSVGRERVAYGVGRSSGRVGPPSPKPLRQRIGACH